MEKLATGFGAIALTISGIFFLVIFSTLMGAVAGYVVGLVFSDAILGVLAAAGIHGVSMWQFGAFMGFFGGFMKTKVTAEVKATK